MESVDFNVTKSEKDQGIGKLEYCNVWLNKTDIPFKVPWDNMLWTGAL